MIITHEYYKLFITILTTSLWRHYQVIITYWKSFINVTILTYYAIGPFLHDYYPLLLRHYKGFHYDQSLHISEWQSLWIYSGNLCKCVTVVTVNQYLGHHFQMLYPHLANDSPTPWCFSPMWPVHSPSSGLGHVPIARSPTPAAWHMVPHRLVLLSVSNY